MTTLTPQQTASNTLDFLIYNFFSNLRAELHETIDQTRVEANIEDEVVRPHIQHLIKRTGGAIEAARAIGAPDTVMNALIEQVQMYNRERHANRVEVKRLAYEQSVNKALLAEVNRTLSIYEAEFGQRLIDENDEMGFAEFCAINEIGFDAEQE